jgi:hypothetical protein
VSPISGDAPHRPTPAPCPEAGHRGPPVDASAELRPRHRRAARWRNLLHVARNTDWSLIRTYESRRSGATRLPLITLARLQWSHGASPDDAYVHGFLGPDARDPSVFVTRGRRHEFTQRTTCVDCALELRDKLRFAARFTELLQRPVLGGPAALQLLTDDPSALGSEVVVKHRWGQSGLGHRFLAGEQAVRHLGAERAAERLTTWTVEPVLPQHPTLAGIFPGSLNTLRLVTLRHGASVEVLPVTLRLGTGARMSDGSTSRIDSFAPSGYGPTSGAAEREGGGLAIAVDEEGRLASTARYRDASLAHVDRHPVTGTRFEDLILPDFDAVMDVVRRAAMRLPGVASVGWDVALTPTGPALLEGNDNWGAILLEVARGTGSLPSLMAVGHDAVYAPHAGRRAAKRSHR